MRSLIMLRRPADARDFVRTALAIAVAAVAEDRAHAAGKHLRWSWAYWWHCWWSRPGTAAVNALRACGLPWSDLAELAGIAI